MAPRLDGLLNGRQSLVRDVSRRNVLGGDVKTLYYIQV